MKISEQVASGIPEGKVIPILMRADRLLGLLAHCLPLHDGAVVVGWGEHYEKGLAPCEMWPLVFKSGHHKKRQPEACFVDLRDPCARDHVRRSLARLVPRTHCSRDDWLDLCARGVAFHGGHGIRSWTLHPWTSMDSIQFVADAKDGWCRESYDVIVVPALADISLDDPDCDLIALRVVSEAVGTIGRPS